MLFRMEEHFKALVPNKVPRKAFTYPVLSEGQHELSRAQQVGRIPTAAAAADLERAAETAAAREAEASPESIFLKASPMMPALQRPTLAIIVSAVAPTGNPHPQEPGGEGALNTRKTSLQAANALKHKTVIQLSEPCQKLLRFLLSGKLLITAR